MERLLAREGNAAMTKLPDDVVREIEKANHEQGHWGCETGDRAAINFKEGAEFGFKLSQAKAMKLVEAGNQLDSALSGLMECEEIECRGDEDCDHCYGVIANQEWDEALAQYKGEK